MKPILIDFPCEFETERLHIRYPMPGDGKAVHQSIQASIEDLKNWMPFARSEQTLDDVEANIRESHVDFLKRTDLRLLLFHKASGEFIGSSGLHRIDWNVRKFEIGYWMDSRYSGHGYMSEAVKGILDFAFDQLKAKRVEIRCNTNNLRSRKVAERVNFDLEAILQNDGISIDGKELIDTCVYAKINK
ncbi:GNAT family N-acetyltransferase [Pseudalkalibacillus hwajinpoensis]|uniref:GNAT family N-acetyltransferase n=1 Tax=Guptibacillus hwajinpoensis TaxID=208199 RepID=A0A4V5PYG1_9BACL|nr:GNAT family N-acetyltransferase [Pseudalkalibacillus hwajinpoensis]TKD69948.1 GNAT family N-acetyltransferase [Pseudalkalibacillus hwajinpoensis]